MKRLKLLLMILISACILLYLVQKIGMGNLYKNITGANPAFLLLSLFFIPFNILLRIGRWFYLVRLVMPDGNFKEATKSFIGGTLMAIITPGKAGDLTRMFFFINEGKKAELTALLAFEKISDIFSYSILSLFMAFRLRIYLGVTLSILSLLILFIILRPSTSGKWFLNCLPGLLRQKLSFINNMISLQQVREKSPFIILMSLAITVFTIIQFFITLNIFGRADIIASFMAFPLSVLIASVPITIGGLGVREGALITILPMFNVPREAAMNASLFFYISNVLPFLCGIFFIPKLLDGVRDWINSLKHKDSSSA